MSEFVGVEELKLYQSNQVKIFRAWAKAQDWQSFHVNHYDWWTFPIKKPSSYGFRYTLNDEAVSVLRNDPEFISNLVEAARLLLLSWGWDLESRRLIDDPEPNQAWADWPIRLYKCHDSLIIFGQRMYAESVFEFARSLRLKGKSFEYSNRDLFDQMAHTYHPRSDASHEAG